MSGINYLDTVHWDLEKNGKLPLDTLILIVKPIGERINKTKFGNAPPIDTEFYFNGFKDNLINYVIKEYEKLGVSNYSKGDLDIDIYNAFKDERNRRTMKKILPLLLVGGFVLFATKKIKF